MSNFKKPDLSAPRFKSKTKNVLCKALFNSFIKKYPKYSDITYDTFKQIIFTYNGNLWQGVIENRDGVELPESLGYLLVAKCDKPKKENIDFAKSIAYGTKVNHINWDSDNFLAKICYSNYSLKYRFADRKLWAFKAVKQFRSTVAKTFPEYYTNYIHLDENLKLAQLYKNI